MSVNKVILVGRLGQDPEVRYTPSGAPVANFSIATSENWTDKTGQRQEKTEWHRIVAWNKLAELCNQYLKKGRQVYLEGRLQTRQWQDQSGQTRYTTEINANTIQFLGGASQSNSYGEQNQSSSQFDSSSSNDYAAAPVGGDSFSGAEPSFTEDDIPF